MLPTTATPGRDRVVLFDVNGRPFGFRRPSRGDVAQTYRRFAAKSAGSLGLPTEQHVLLNWDGDALLWEARLEVGLAPRVEDGKVLDLGETCPPNWLRGGTISFESVDPEEFDSVCKFLDAEVFKKKATPSVTAPSGPSATEATNA